jgi:hypothetical protein
LGGIQKREPHDWYYREREIATQAWDAAVCGKPFRMITAMQAFGWCHQYSIGYLLIARHRSTRDARWWPDFGLRVSRQLEMMGTSGEESGWTILRLADDPPGGQ